MHFNNIGIATSPRRHMKIEALINYSPVVNTEVQHVINHIPIASVPIQSKKKPSNQVVNITVF